MSFRDLILRLRSYSPRRFKAVKCGHIARRVGNLSAFGHSGLVELSLDKDGVADYCIDCLGKMAIRCAWCGEPIHIGEPVTLYTPNGTFKIPDFATVYSDKPVRLVGCLGWDCADTGADRAGFWLVGKDGKGYVQRVPTAYEAILGAGSSSAVVVNDLHDIAEAMSPDLIPLA